MKKLYVIVPIVATVVFSNLYYFTAAAKKSDMVSIRVAALAYAFEHDSESANGIWVFTVESDKEKFRVFSIEKDLLVKNYEHPIYEQGIQLIGKDTRPTGRKSPK